MKSPNRVLTMPVNRISMICSCAIREAISPRRMPCSSEEENNGMSASAARVLLPYEVSEMVEAPLDLAQLKASIVSGVSPE
ncbi:hypothetical protein D3C80_1376180 [compost metagenome]